MRVGSVEALRHAYPNHFADTTVFVAEVKKAIRKEARAPKAPRRTPA